MNVHRYELAVLKALQGFGEISFAELLQKSSLGKDEVLWVLESLSKSGAINVKKSVKESVELTSEGKKYASSSLPETALIERAAKKSVEIKTLADSESRIGLQWAKSKNLIAIDSGLIKITELGRKAIEKGIGEETVLKKLSQDGSEFSKLYSHNKTEIENLLKRKLIVLDKKNEIDSISITSHGTTLLSGAKEGHGQMIDSLDRKMITNKEWKGKSFKPYDVSVGVEGEIPAKSHPLRRMINQIKGSYVSMGFKEVSGPIVIPAFWNFDTLFTPQDHPAREVQDTFYLSNPKMLEIGNKGVMKKVKEAHEEAWHSQWAEEVAMQGVLRTQMTSVSIQELYNIAKYKDYKLPLKLFSLGRVFRNENIDYKHLTDFYQTDGIIVGENLTLANLFDTLTKIYKGLGIKIKFKPAYFPFVEPGAEVYGYHEQRKEWLEIAGCGILRKEISGIAKKNITVLAWGSSVERLLLIKDEEIERLSDLYNNGIGWGRSKRMV